MILYGSQTSPFVRRLRLLLPENTYEFHKVDIFNATERKKYISLSPLLKIPFMEIDGQVIWDSRVIFNELCRRGYHPSLILPEENILTAINDLSDSLIQTYLALRSKVEFPVGSPIELSHRERIENTLTYLVHRVELGDFAKWNFLAMSLFTLLDWIEFRQIVSLSGYPILQQFVEKNRQQNRVALTNPRIV